MQESGGYSLFNIFETHLETQNTKLQQKLANYIMTRV